jgi:hypothetical protein
MDTGDFEEELGSECIRMGEAYIWPGAESKTCLLVVCSIFILVQLYIRVIVLVNMFSANNNNNNNNNTT